MRKVLEPYDGDPRDPDVEVLNAYVIRPDEVQPGDVFGWKYVCVVFEFFPGWCVYKGGTLWTDAQVKAFGDEVDKKTAELLFPAIAQSKNARVYGNC